ncbi:DUF4159 domain-containing protein [Lichenicola cladoniae]|uniref:DUF4159 domain-containing protein n=1 Tax=Lichenicola cladoniae TaxID=1484109 RepID=A0A6M8HMP5_9PROT|nr:DUF4159 domain-containing protein [Lichenicola cladoniae]NPD67022.1 DUF4159 domain-containing protein [Acetobacteraceae bacterium]QKE89570.1 DUF4159 domain-containing protein [Lichenicola cladoniae]
MILTTPLLLLGLAVLPVLWWLLRALPPAPRVQSFPAIRLLDGLRAAVRESRRAPPWLLLLRIAAAVLLVVGLAQPVLVQDPHPTAGTGTLLLAIDDGWAAAPDWTGRLQAARETLDRAARNGRKVRLLMTAADINGVPPRLTSEMPAGLLRDRLDQARPMPWPVDRAASAKALRQAGARIGDVVYLSDGLADRPGTPADGDFATALRQAGPVIELRSGPDAIALLDAPISAPGRLVARIRTLGQPGPRHLVLRGETEQGGTLGRTDVTIPTGATRMEVPITLPAELRNQLSRLLLDGVPGPAGVRLLDEGDRRRPVGLLSSGGGDTPLLGTLFYLRRALAPTADLREGDLAHLLSNQLSVLIAPDGALEDQADRNGVSAWVKQGGTLIRFAGPRLAARQDAQLQDSPAAGRTDTTDGDLEATGATVPATPADSLLPVALLGGARQLGGTMSWGKPEHPAAFAADSPFAGLTVPSEVTVSRQVLAQPTADIDARSWARLTDGTPLVTHATLGDGQLVLFHVTSTADWSNLALSGLFPQMLQRLVQRAAGLSTPGDRTVLAPVSTLGGDGVLGPPPPSAQGLAADAFGHTMVSPRHPAGLYGPAATRRSLNLADALPSLGVEPVVGTLRNLADRVPDRPLGPTLLVMALALLAIDLLATMWLRGLLRPATVHRLGRGSGGAALLLVGGFCAAMGYACPALAIEPSASSKSALETHLAYVVTGDPAVDEISRQGLEGLSAYTNARTSAQLGHPDGVVPGRDDLAFYPLIYWPVTPATVASAHPGQEWTAALNFYMSHGGILLIDTQGSDSQGDATGGSTFFVPGTGQALKQATAGLDIPALRPVDGQHVLSHSFYLLHGFPGRTTGPPVWVARDDDLGNDGVSPVIIGANDWAAAWAVDADGQTPYAAIPGGESQRVTAYRFGVNAVMYALTGNYKTDQVHVPALLERLGQ